MKLVLALGVKLKPGGICTPVAPLEVSVHTDQTLWLRDRARSQVGGQEA